MTLDPAELARIASTADANPSAAATALRALADQLDAPADGPVDVCAFRWGVRESLLEPASHALLSYLWPRRHRPTQARIAVDEIWGVVAGPHSLRGAVARINRALRAVRYPQRLKVKAGLLTFSETSVRKPCASSR